MTFEVEPRATIIIPCITVDTFTIRCVDACVRLCPEAEIIVVSDMELDRDFFRGSDRVSILISGRATIAKKRNLAAEASRGTYLAFIDSDAYPVEGWLDNAVSLLDKNDELGAVGGPNLAPPDQSLSERYVGFALKSPFVSGKWTYRKTIRPARLVADLPSCNLIVRKDQYIKMGGMNEDLFTGEDMDFCARLVHSEKGILYSPDVIVFHNNRSLKDFLFQRMAYGASVPNLLRQDININYILLLLPSLFIVFIFSYPLAVIWLEYKYIYFFIICVYLIGIVLEALRHSDRVVAIPGTILALIIGNLTPGLGTIISAFKIMPSYKEMYRNRR